MQVKKFEARSMKEALQMVKSQLGPEAIILSARDINRGFGLVGQSSVEITAAITDEYLHKKRFVESRLKEDQRQKLMATPAKMQRQVIDKMVNRYVEQNNPKVKDIPLAANNQVTGRRYIDIHDDLPEHTVPRYVDIQDNDQGSVQELGGRAQLRIKSAAQSAWNAMNMHVEPPKPESKLNVGIQQVREALGLSNHKEETATRAAGQTTEILNLKNEIQTLKQVINQFSKMPQNMAGTHPGAQYGLPYEFSFSYDKLTAAGIAEDVVADILTKAQQTMPVARAKNKALIDAWVAKFILDTTEIASDKNTKKINCFVGPAGSGKTAALVKMASRLIVKEKKKVLILTTDSYKVGAADQLKIYAQILNVPFAAIRNAGDWVSILKQMNYFDFILVDFPASSMKTMDDISQIKSLLPADLSQVTINLVLSATAKDIDLTETGKRYRPLGFHNFIFNNLDESTQHGSIYNLMIKYKTPLLGFGIGTKIPEDFEPATKERLLDLIFKLTKFKSSQER